MRTTSRNPAVLAGFASADRALSLRPLKRTLRNSVGFALALLLLASSAPVHAEAERLPDLIRRVTPGVVTIISYKPDRAMPGIGTGFFVAPDRVLTARHVLAGADRARIRTHDGTSIGIMGLIAENRDADLAMVQLEKPVESATVLRIAENEPDVGESLFAVSSPLGFEFTASSGIVSAYRQIDGAGSLVQHTVPISAGSSGCALLNDRGEVVAVQTGMITTNDHLVSAGQGLNFAVAAKLISHLRPGTLKKLSDVASEVPDDWVSPITSRLDSVSLHALTRDDFKSSLDFFRQATIQTPDEPDVWFRLGLCFEKTGEKEKAVENYRKAIQLNPTFALAMNNLGCVYTSMGKYADAAKVLTQAVESKKDYGQAYGNLAFALVEKEDWPAALKAAREAVRLTPKDPEAHLSLARAALHTGDLDEARHQYDELQKLDKPRAQRLKRMLDEHSKESQDSK